jgi:hypothetical protein
MRCPGRQPGRRPRLRRGQCRLRAHRAPLLWRVLIEAYSSLGLDVLGDEAFRAMVLARIVETTSKADSLRVLAELGAPRPSLSTLFRSLKRGHDSDYRGTIAKACAARSAAAGGGGAGHV